MVPDFIHLTLLNVADHGTRLDFLIRMVMIQLAIRVCCFWTKAVCLHLSIGWVGN